MKKRIKKLYVTTVILMSGTLICMTGCNNKNSDNNIGVDSTEVIETQANENNVDTKKNKNKDRKDESYDTEISVEDLASDALGENSNNTDNVELKDQIEYSGVDIDTDNVDFSVYQLDSLNLNNDKNAFDREPGDFLKELSESLTELYSIYLIPISEYVDDKSFESTYGHDFDYMLSEAKSLLDKLETDNTVMMNILSSDTELIDSWNRYYEDAKELKEVLKDTNKKNASDLDITNIQSDVIELSNIIIDRLQSTENTQEENDTIVEDSIIEENK